MPFFVECNLEAGSNQYTFMLGGDEMLCAPGTIFNLTECACVHDPNPYTRTYPIVIVVRQLVSARVSLGVDNCQVQTEGNLYKLCHMLFRYHPPGCATIFETSEHKLCLFEGGPP